MFKKVSRVFRKNKSKKRKHRNFNSKLTMTFLTSTTKKTFDTLKIVFMKIFLLYHFDFKCKLRVEIDAFIKIIDDDLCQFKNDEWHSIIYFSQKMNSTQCNYETHDQKLLIIVETFKHWRHYFERIQHEMLMFINHHNFKKFMTTTKLSFCQVRWAQKLSRYNFNINYKQNKKNFANALSRRSNFMQKNDDAIEKNKRILHRLQMSFRLNFAKTKLKNEIINVSCDVESQSNIDWQIIMTKAICVIERDRRVATMQSVMKSNKIYDDEMIQFIVDLIFSLLLDDSFVIVFRKKLTIFEKNNEIWIDEIEIFRHNDKLYVSKRLRIDVLKLYHDDFLTKHFDIKKTLNLLQRKYYWSNKK